MSIAKYCDDYVVCRREYELQRGLLKEAYSSMMRAKARMIDEMLAEETKAFKRDDGLHVILRKSVTFSTAQKMADTIRDWLVETVGDDQPFIEEKISKKALSAYIKQKLDDGADESDFPEFLRLSTRPDVTVRGFAGANDDEEKEDEDEF